MRSISSTNPQRFSVLDLVGMTYLRRFRAYLAIDKIALTRFVDRAVGNLVFAKLRARVAEAGGSPRDRIRTSRYGIMLSCYR